LIWWREFAETNRLILDFFDYFNDVEFSDDCLTCEDLPNRIISVIGATLRMSKFGTGIGGSASKDTYSTVRSNSNSDYDEIVNMLYQSL
jgi:hypothetical protein